MSTPRLTFLNPHLFSPARVPTTSLTPKPLGPTQTPFRKAGISTTRPQKQETYPQRYGTAAEPQPPPNMPSNPQEQKSLAGVIEREKAEFSRDAAIKTTLRDPSVRATELNASESRSKQPSAEASSDNKARTAKPLETLMQMGAPELEKPGEHKTPYMQPPPYVRHFDTYTLMKDLHQGGFSEDQSVTTMKAVRGLLAVNLDIAKEGLFSKSDVENVNNTPFYAFPLFPT
ncbi:MAG: hypothetical protein OHK93_005542 [Ramalina farinacea]|uniref:Uncharacterized protein n=1 Tax=Ramalina farinacea TaxID=258253 RepID=A0AA43TTL4_9LECA|nr:hypothetical protein [Ramalina farinacea]